MNDDDKPTEKPTVEFTAPPEWAVKMSERMVSEFAKTNANISIVSNDLTVVKDRLVLVEDWKRKLESPSVPPPPPITSARVKALIDANPSQTDLEIQAAQAAEIVKNQERDRQIAELHARAATKEDVAKLAAETATKAEVEKAIKDANKGQTTDIVTSLEALAARNKTVRNLLIALAGLAFLAMNAATTYLMRPAPVQQPTQIQVTK